MQQHLILTHIEIYPSLISHIIKDHSGILNNFEKSAVINDEPELSKYLSEVKSLGNVIGIILPGKEVTIIWKGKKYIPEI
jgi:hypothetical protein